MRHHTALIMAAAALALAMPAAALAAAPANHHYAPATIVTSVYPGTTAVPGACTMTLVSGHVSSFRCPGITQSQATGSRCTLTVAAAPLWTYSCPAGTAGTAVHGAARGAIPSSCKQMMDFGFRSFYACPRSAFTLR